MAIPPLSHRVRRLVVDTAFWEIDPETHSGLGLSVHQFLTRSAIPSVQQSVVLEKPDPIDNLGVADYNSIPVRIVIVRFFGRYFRFLPEPGSAAARDPGSPPSTRRSLAIRQSTQADVGGSMAVGLALYCVKRLAVQRLYRQSRDRHRLAPEGLSLVLGLEGPTR